jgi:hypothetical protein
MTARGRTDRETRKASLEASIQGIKDTAGRFREHAFRGLASPRAHAQRLTWPSLTARGGPLRSAAPRARQPANQHQREGTVSQGHFGPLVMAADSDPHRPLGSGRTRRGRSGQHRPSRCRTSHRPFHRLVGPATWGSRVGGPGVPARGLPLPLPPMERKRRRKAPSASLYRDPLRRCGAMACCCGPHVLRPQWPLRRRHARGGAVWLGEARDVMVGEGGRRRSVRDGRGHV